MKTWILTAGEYSDFDIKEILDGKDEDNLEVLHAEFLSLYGMYKRPDESYFRNYDRNLYLQWENAREEGFEKLRVAYPEFVKDHHKSASDSVIEQCFVQWLITEKGFIRNETAEIFHLEN